ncbi:hypothetical protein B6S44_14845 [Bosea sp. Tri-44]|nr:hypothetical protein B6S44_14845 [Bosea sp. Tri-44]
MIEQFRHLRNIGQFENVTAGAQLPLAKLNLIYAENGRGKTTLASLLRSLQTNDAVMVVERQRLGTQDPAQIVILAAGVAHVFQQGRWSAPLSQLAIFDDVFVAQNVCSGIEIGAQHRQNLHELILGAQGVALNSALQSHVDRIEAHNQELRAKGDAIPPAIRGVLSVDAFSALELLPGLPELISDAERRLAAARAGHEIQNGLEFEAVSLPSFDVAAISALLRQGLPELEQAAAAHVQSHLAKLGRGGESWIADGISRIGPASQGHDQEICPFCEQGLVASPVIDHYRAFFSEAYALLRQALAAQREGINAAHAGEIPAAFERNVRILEERRQFWRQFIRLPGLQLDTAAIARAWRAARDAVLQLLARKQGAPLDPLVLPPDVTLALETYERERQAFNASVEATMGANPQIALAKEQAAAANVDALAADLARLKAIDARHSQEISLLCEVYLTEKSAKAVTEGQRDQARQALDQYRQNVFPAYEASINAHLIRFNAGFRLGAVSPVNNRAGSSANYNVVINNIPVGLGANAGAPSFRNTLSAGDRNTLALAFFFSALESDPGIANKIVIIDDPMTSLDEHRSLATIQELNRLVDRVGQVIILSHSKAFLCQLSDASDRHSPVAIRIARDGQGSTLAPWDIRQDSITVHDKRHEVISAYLRANNPAQEREVATAIRPILEAFLRVAYPAHFPPGTMLGGFIGRCRTDLGGPNEILTQADINELDDLRVFGNRFHHDSNPAWQVEIINDQELVRFSQRTLAFTRRP